MKKQERLWAPWRAGYITAEKKKGCFLCSALKGRGQNADRKNFLIYRGEHAFVILNLFPYNNGHIMIAPNRHVKDIEMLREDEDKELMALIKASAKIMKKVMKAQGFNAGINLGKVSGAGLESHIHFHFVPRWAGDTNFMPVVFNSKVISQSLEETYKLLHPEFEKLRKCI